MKEQKTEHGKEQAFLDRVKSELDSSCEQMNIQTRSRLEKIRQEVLDTALVEQQARNINVLYPAAAFVTASVLVFMLIFFDTSQTESTADFLLSDLAPEDIEILVTDDDLEFYEEIDFYQWLSMNEDF